MGMTDDDDTVYCDVQMPLAQGRELLQIVTALRESNAHPNLDRVFERMQRELHWIPVICLQKSDLRSLIHPGWLTIRHSYFFTKLLYCSRVERI